MSAQSAKKKRIGSRRRVPNQNKTTNADEFHIPDSVSVAEPYTPEENTESLNVLADPDHLQSETPNPPSPELTTNRRKLGSSRRNKGGQRVKDSATESYHKPSEEKTRDDETPHTTQMSLAMQSQRQEELSQGREHDIMSLAHDSSLYSAITPDYSSEVQYSKTNYPDTDQESFIPKSENLQADQDENDENKIESDSCKLLETVLVGTTKSDTLQSEELEENADLVGTSELTSLSVLPCPTVDQQLIDQSESRKIPEELECVYSVTEEESKERDKDTELSKQNGNLQDNYLVSESHAKSVVAQFSATPEKTTDKSSPRENTKLEYIVEQATFLTPNKELPKDEEQHEQFSLSEVKSEDAVNKMHEQEVNQTERHEIDHSSESVTHDAAEKSEIISGNLIDQAEVSDASQSELVVKSNDDSTTKQEDSNSDDRQDGHPAKENNFGALEHTNEDYHVYDTKKLQSSGIERGDTAQNRVYEDDGQEGDDRKSSAKQTVHREKQGLFSEMEESNTSLQTEQAETNASLDSQPQQNDTGFNTFGNRRKLGSSRRNKGRQHFKEPAGESYHDHKESTTGNEALETTEMSVAIERTSQEELSQGSERDVIMPATHDSSLQDHDDHDFKMVVSDKSVGVTSEGMDESGTLQEVLGAVNKVHGQEVNPTHDTDRPSESVTNDATENSEIISENLIEQAEVSDTYQSELVMKRTDDSATRQDDSNPDDKQDDHPSKENNLEALEYKNDYHVDDIKSSAEQTHDEENEETFYEMESESSLQTLQSEANAPLDSQPLDNSVRIEEQNDTRKLGSSCRNKVRQQVKESVVASYHDHKKEVLESAGYNEPLETTQMLVTIEGQKELSQEGEHSVMSATHDSSFYSNIPDSFEVLNPTIPTYSETDLEDLIHKSENLQEEYDQTETDFKVEVFDESVEVERIGKSETLQSQEVRGAHHSEDAEQDNPTQMHEMPGIVSSQSMLHDADDTDDSATKHEDSNPFDKQDEHPTEENNSEVLEQTNEDYQVHDTKKLQIGGIIGADAALGQVDEIEGRVENDMKPSAEQTVHQEKGLRRISEESEDIESSITPEISTEKHSISEHTQAEEELPTNEEQSEHFNSSEAKDAQYSEDAVNKVCEQEVKTTQVHEIDHSPESVTHEATENPEIIPGNLIGQADDTDTYQSELIVKSTDDSTTRQEDSNFDDKQDEHPTKENSEALEHTNEDYHVYDTKKQPTRGIENADTEVSQVYEIEGQVEDDIKPTAEQAVHQEKQGLSSEIEQDDSPLQSLQSESNAPLDSKPQQDDTKFNPIGNRRKLGSSRRNKRRPHAKESVVESYHRPTEEASGNAKENEPLETIKMLLTIETAVQENSMETTLEGMDSYGTAQTEEVSDQVKENPHVDTLGGISELTASDLHSSLTVNQQLIDQPNSTEMTEQELPSVSSVTVKESNERHEDSELLSKDGNLEGDNLVSESHLKSEDMDSSITLKITTERQSSTEHTQPECSVGQAICSSPKEELPSSEEQIEHFSLPEVKGAQDSEDFVNKVREQEINPTQMHEMPGIVSSQSMLHDADDTDDSATKHKDSNPFDKQDEHPTEENNSEVLEQTNEDYHVHDTKKLQIGGIIGADAALGQVDEIEGRVENDMKPSAEQTVHQEKGLNDSHLKSEDIESSVTPEISTEKHSISEHTQAECSVEQAMFSSTQEELPTNEEQSEHFNSSEAKDAQYSEDAVNKLCEQEVKTTQVHEIDHSPESVTHEATENPEIIPGNLIGQADDTDTYQSELIVKSADDSTTRQEDSNFDDKQDEHPTKENSEALEHTNEDYHVYDTKKQPTRGIENADTEVSQVYEIEGQVEDDIKPTAEQAVHQEKQGLSSEIEQDDSPLQSLQSESNAPLDSKPQQDDTKFNPIGNRRKLGSSRRNKRRPHAKESVVESYHRPTEEASGNAKENEPLETIKMLLTIETAVQENSMETTLEGMDSYGTAQTEEVSDQVKENPHVDTLGGISELTASDLHSSLTVNQQLIDQPNSTEMTEQELPSVSSVTVKESNERHEDSELLSKDGNLEGDNLVSESHLKSEDMDSSITLKITTERQSSTEHTQPECSVGQAICSSPKEELPSSEEQIEHFSLPEVKGAQDSEDFVNKVREQEINPTQMHEMPGIVSSQSMLHDADDTDDSATKHKDSNPFDKQDEHPTEENNSEVLEQTNEDYHVHDTKKLQIGGIIGADAALGQVDEIEGRVENDMKPSAEQTVHQEKGLNDSHLKSEDIESSVTPEISTEKHSISEHTQAECSVEQAMFSSTQEELPTNEEQSEHFNSSEAKDAQYSEDAVNKLCEQEVKTTQVHEIDHSPESVTHEATENPEIIPGNLIGQADDTDTYQSELIVKSADDSTTRQEDSNFDDKQDEHPTKENSEALEHTNEDYHVYDTKKQPTRGIENADTEVSQVYEIEGQVEDDIKPTAEQAVHQEKQGLSSEIEQDDSPLQSLQSESNAPLDSKPQQDDTKFNPIGNRRKLGSSRRNKRRPHAKESVVESYHRPTEEASGNAKENEPLETIKMLLTIETAVQENSMETTLEGMDSYGTAQTEEVSDQVKEIPHVDTLGGISELTASNLHSSLTVNQQLIDQPNSTEMTEQELPSVSSVTVKESNERHENSELLSKDGNLEDDNLVSESHLKSEDMDSSITLKITTERQSSTEHTQPECSVGQAICSSPKEELPSSKEQIEHFSLPEVKGAQDSEGFVNKVREQEINPTQIHEIGHPSESVTHDVTENSELISANLINQAEVSDTHQSEIVEKSTDDFASKQEDSNPDAKQDDDSTKEDNFKALEQTNEDYHVSDTKKQQTSGVENEDTALGQVYEIEGQGEDDIKPCAERTGYQDKEGIFSEMEESESSLQTLQSDTNAPLDFQPQVDSLRTEEQIHTGFNPIGNRRKLGSSRRNKGRQQLKGSVAESSHEHKDVLESTRGNETLESTDMLMTIEKTSQEELSQEHEHDIIIPVTHDSSLHSTIIPESSEVQNPTSTNYPEAVLESLNPKSEKLQEDCDERETDFKVDVSDRSSVAELEGINKSNTPQSQEVIGGHHSEDAVVHEQEINPTQKHEMEHFSESVTHDVTENPELISANLIKQTEVSDTHQSELIVKSTDDFATKQEDSNPDAKWDDDSTKEDHFKALEQTNEDYDVYDTNKQETSGIENKDTILGQIYEIEGQVEDDINPSTEQTVPQEKQGLFSDMEEGEFPLQTLQSEINAPLDPQPLQNNTNINPIGNRRKLGSSRRNKGRQHAKDSGESCHKPTEEVVGNTRDNELLEITKMSLTIETTGIGTCDTTQTEEVSEHIKENVHVGTLDDISEFTSLHSSLTVDHQIVHQSNITETAEQELPNVPSVTAKESNERDEDTELLSRDGNLQDYNLDIGSSMTPEITTEKSSPEHTDIEYSSEQAAFTSPKEEWSSNEEQKEHVNLSQVRGSLHVLNEEAVKPTQTEETHQIDKLTYIEESESSLQTLQSEMNAPLDSQPLDTSARKEEKIHPGFNPTGNRRKLGSSRRNKGRQHVKDSVTDTYHKPEEEFVVNTRGDEVLETATTETMKQEELKTQIDLELKATQKTRKKRSTVNEEEDAEKVPEEDGNTSVTTDITSSPEKDGFIKSNKDIDEEENNLTKEPENFSHLTGHDTVKTYLIQSPEDDSDIQTISSHDDKATAKSVISELLEQEDANKVRNTDTLSCDKDSLRQEIIMQQTNDAVETVGDIKIKDYNTGAECSMDVQVFGQDEAGEKSEDPAKKDHDPQGMDASLEITHAELFSAAHNKTDTFAPSDIHLEENFRAEPAEDVLEESGISTAVMQEKTNLDDSENSPEESKQKRRKMGSTRRIRLKRIPEEGMDNEDKMKESNLNMEADMKDFDKMEAVEELPVTVTAEVLQNENVKSSDLQSIQSHLTSVIGGLTAVLPGQSASHNEDVIDHVTFVQVTDIGDREKNVDINIQPSQVDITYVQNDEDRSESANVIQDQALKSAEASVVAVADLEIVKSVARGGAAEEQKDTQAGIQELTNMNEEAHSKNVEMKNASPNLNSPNRRRKMGSSRRSLGSRRKEEDLHQKPQVDNEATEAATKVEDVKTESFPSIKEKEEPQLHIEDKDGDSEQGKEKVSETVEYSHTGETLFKPPSHQTFAESPASQGQLVEMEPQLTPSYVPVVLSTSPKHDVMSETAGGRRRKMGSHRKSRAHQNNENQTTREDRVTDTQHVSECVTEESSVKTTEEESLGLDKISEVDEGDKKPSSSISTSNAGELPKPVSEKTPKQVTPVQQPYAEIHLGQESQRTLSLAGSSGGTPLRSKSYNVMMIGDSSVGKTSFMKRAQSGKFSLDLPASVGLDSCKWTVVVDGKPVVLHLWDTAGQERFHSITRQIFHKAQAFLLMYDITSSQSFAAVSYWANCIQEGAAENVTILLIGNKSDCAERQVQTQEGESLAKEYNYEFMECSAATGENVIQSLETVARMLSQKVDTREETMVLRKEPQQKKSSGCC